MNFVFLVFDGFDALDVVGPYEALVRVPGARATFAAPTPGIVCTENGALRFNVETAIDEITDCDLALVPGGFVTRKLESDQRLLSWLRAIDRTTSITASVCTGAMLLAAAGLLRGRRANTHWAFRHRLLEYGAKPVAERVVRDGKYATAAGVSAGIDLGLTLAAELAGRRVAEAIQLGLEYDPDPPFDAGDAARVPTALRLAVLGFLRMREMQRAR